MIELPVVNASLSRIKPKGSLDHKTISSAKRDRWLPASAADPEAEIGRDLVVARARGVEAPGDGADQLGEPRLDVEVDVFVGFAEHKGAAVDLAADLL